MNDSGTTTTGTTPHTDDADIDEDLRVDTLLSSAFDTATIRALERPLLDDGVPLMRIAAGAAAKHILDVVADEEWDLATLRVCVLAGAGEHTDSQRGEVPFLVGDDVEDVFRGGAGGDTHEGDPVVEQGAFECADGRRVECGGQ